MLMFHSGNRSKASLRCVKKTVITFVLFEKGTKVGKMCVMSYNCQFVTIKEAKGSWNTCNQRILISMLFQERIGFLHFFW